MIRGTIGIEYILDIIWSAAYYVIDITSGAGPNIILIIFLISIIIFILRKFKLTKYLFFSFCLTFFFNIIGKTLIFKYTGINVFVDYFHSYSLCFYILMPLISLYLNSLFFYRKNFKQNLISKIIPSSIGVGICLGLIYRITINNIYMLEYVNPYLSEYFQYISPYYICSMLASVFTSSMLIPNVFYMEAGEGLGAGPSTGSSTGQSAGGNTGTNNGSNFQYLPPIIDREEMLKNIRDKLETQRNLQRNPLSRAVFDDNFPNNAKLDDRERRFMIDYIRNNPRCGYSSYTIYANTDRAKVVIVQGTKIGSFNNQAKATHNFIDLFK